MKKNVVDNENTLTNFLQIAPSPTLTKKYPSESILNEESFINIEPQESLPSPNIIRNRNVKEIFISNVRKLIRSQKFKRVYLENFSAKDKEKHLKIFLLFDNIKTNNNLNPAKTKFFLPAQKILFFFDQNSKNIVTLQKFMKSSFTRIFLFLVTLTNVILYCLFDYSIAKNPIKNNSSNNNFNIFIIELICNLIFLIEGVIRILTQGLILNKKAYLRKPLQLLNFSVMISSFLSYLENTQAAKVFKVIRLIRVMRIIDFFPKLKSAKKAFVLSVWESKSVIFNVCYFFFLFITIGINIFAEAIEKRCRLTPEPEIIGNQTVWLVDPSQIFPCGSNSNCEINTYCYAASERGLPWNKSEANIVELNYGISDFSDYFHASLSGLNYLTFTGWSGINDIFWNSVDKALVAVYSIGFLLVVGLILFQLLTASLYHGYVNNNEGIKSFALKIGKNKKKEIPSSTTYIVVNNADEGTNKNKKVLKLKLFIKLNEYYKKYEKIFNFWIALLVIFNIVIILIDRYEPNKDFTTMYKLIDNLEIFFVVFFSFEIFIKLIIFGIRPFFSNYFNILDLLIIIPNIIALIYSISVLDEYSTHEYLSISIIRTFKILRIFRFIVELNVWVSGATLFLEMVNALAETVDFLFIILIFILTTALIGMELFCFHDEIDHKTNYDTLAGAILTNTLIFLNEEWHIIMFDFMRNVGEYSALYFVTVLIIGTILMNKMFLGLFINKFLNTNKIKNLIETKPFFKQLMKNFKSKLNIIFNKTLSILQDKTNNLSPSNFSPQNERRKSKFKKISIVTLRNKSLYIFSPVNKFRLFLLKIMNSKNFDRFIIFSIIASVIILSLKEPLEDPSSLYSSRIFIADVVILILYCFEILIKIIVFGLIFNGPNSYLRNPINMIDFIILGLTFIGTLDEKIAFSTINLKMFRVFRFFKIIYLTKGLKNAVHLLFLSIPEIIRVLFFYMLNLMFFGAIAVKIFKGGMYYCKDLDPVNEQFVKTKFECLDFGGNWLIRDLNYDNIFVSMSSLFQICTTEGWMHMMFQAMRFTHKIGVQTSDYNKNVSIFYIIFFCIANLVLNNILVGVLVGRFFAFITKQKKEPPLRPEVKEWVQIKEQIYRLKPQVKIKPPTNPFRKALYLLIKHPYFNYFSICYTVSNGVLSYHNDKTILYVTIALSSLLLVEVILRLIVQTPKKYFSKRGNLMDCGIIIVSLICYILIFIIEERHNLTYVILMLNVVNIFRILRIINKIKFLKRLLKIIKVVIPEIANIGILFFSILLIYGIIGVDLFAYLKPQSSVGTKNIHFRNVFISIINLIRSSTGESWHLQLHDVARSQSPDFVCYKIDNYNDYKKYGLNGCGKPIEAYLYYFSFIVILALLTLNLFVAIIITSTEEVSKIEDLCISRYQLSKIRKAWKDFDPNAKGFLDYKYFWKFLSIITMILGVQREELLDLKNKKNILKALQLPVYENKSNKIFCYRFHDVIITLAKVAVMIKYKISHLEPDFPLTHLINYELQLKNDKNYKLTIYNSGDMASIIYIYDKIRRNIKKLLQRAKLSKTDEEERVALSLKKDLNQEDTTSFQWPWFPYEKLIVKIMITIQWIFITLYMTYLSQINQSKIQGLEDSYFGLKRDTNDLQWRIFQENLPLMMLGAVAFNRNNNFNLKVILKKVASHLIKQNNKKLLIPFYFICGFVYITYLYRAAIIFWLILTLFNYILTKIGYKWKCFYIIQWIFAILTLYLNKIAADFTFSKISSSLTFLDDSINEAPVQWFHMYNMTIVRTMSFSLDYAWSFSKPTITKEDHMKKCTECNEKVNCYKLCQDMNMSLDQYNFINYYAYLAYMPLFLAGPMVTFNAFYSQINNGGQNTHSFKQVVTYVIRVFLDFLALQLFLHFIYSNAISTNPNNSHIWMSFNLFGVWALGFFELIFLWLKFLVIWRICRAWSLCDGIEVPENMNRCMLNNHTFEGFWRSWHRSFNQWLIRYIFIPLGGSKYKMYNIWAIFSFVAIWHDFNINLILWAWCICLSLIPEMIIKKYFSGKKHLWDKIWWKYCCALGASFDIFLLVFANLIGFGIGAKGMQHFSERFFGLEGIIMFCASIFIYFVIALTQFIIRDYENENKLLVKGF